MSAPRHPLAPARLYLTDTTARAASLVTARVATLAADHAKGLDVVDLAAATTRSIAQHRANALALAAADRAEDGRALVEALRRLADERLAAAPSSDPLHNEVRRIEGVELAAIARYVWERWV